TRIPRASRATSEARDLHAPRRPRAADRPARGRDRGRPRTGGDAQSGHGRTRHVWGTVPRACLPGACLRGAVAAAVRRGGLRRLLLVARARDEHGPHPAARPGAAAAAVAAAADRLPRTCRLGRRRRNGRPPSERTALGWGLRAVAEARLR